MKLFLCRLLVAGMACGSAYANNIPDELNDHYLDYKPEIAGKRCSCPAAMPEF